MMRIITGTARGTKLMTLEGVSTRPTAERVKEAVFSMLQFELEGRAVLDLFAGSGQMGLEAVSRGAAHADLVDRSRDAIEVVRKNMIKTKLALDCTIKLSDAMDFLRRNRGVKFDIVFLDPPYAAGLYAPMLHAMIECDILKPTSIIVCESDSNEIFAKDEVLARSFEIKRVSRYSKTVITLLTPKEEQ